MNWTEKLLLWYSENKRSFVWRSTKEPYHIWISEIILQQTRTSQGLPYYKIFLKTFPLISDLATADENEVLKLWQGLGYYSRARNLHATAKYIHFECGGIFPSSFDDLIKLKGIGDYTASAISSICFDIPEAVVDGNVYRFLARYFGIDTPINSSLAHKLFKAKAMDLIDKQKPGDFNQAIMEFGAIQCTPQNPNCQVCPFSIKCVAFNQDKLTVLPVKIKKPKIKKRHFNYLLISDKKNRYLIEQRTQKGIWKQLYQFPLLESDQEINNINSLINHHDFPSIQGLSESEITLWNSEPILHKLSHQILLVNFWILPTNEPLKEGLSLKQLESLPVPVIIQNFMKNFFSFAP
ncbi:MAG: A/G-specific adenine glycosylase [Flavobacteriaceae bacterium]|nr:A/G-specific adenine glycosylase [Flavobacteriaceae bacterium]